MLNRRLLLAGTGALLAGCSASPAPTQPAATMAPPSSPPPPPVVSMPPVSSAPVIDRASYDAFLRKLRVDARAEGITAGTVQEALSNLQPLPRVIELDRKQPEGVLTWEQYRDRIVSNLRIQNGRKAYAENAALLQQIEARYNVSPRVIVAIWGMETNYGSNTGGFNVIESLATLAWEGRRATFFRKELIAALRILDQGNVSFSHMTGSWAGAMGHPQFMPSSFNSYAVDFDGDGHKNIWDSKSDALASIANYLARSGWQSGQGWAMEARPPAGFDIERVNTDTQRPLRGWAQLGWRKADGSPLPASDTVASLAVPTRSSGQVFLGLPNLRVIRRYNSPMNYGLAVSMLADRVA